MISNDVTSYHQLLAKHRQPWQMVVISGYVLLDGGVFQRERGVLYVSHVLTRVIEKLTEIKVHGNFA